MTFFVLFFRIHTHTDTHTQNMAKASASSANPLTLIGDFTNPLGIAATVVVIALVLGCAGQLIQLLTPKKTKKKSGGAATRASARASSS